MSIMIAAAIAATQSVAPAAAQPAPMDHSRMDHAKHRQAGAAEKAGCACCKDMAQGSARMPCCADHKAADGDHSGHGAGQ